MTLPLEPAAPPAGFAAALSALHDELAGAARPGLELRTVPAPTRMAPHAVAVAGDVERDEGSFERAHELLDWTPAIGLPEGLATQAAWARKRSAAS
ncbi:MAG: DUF3000 domain-containing protein [Actinobacteria bacterium]|nr:DUF3000 domain-containing protein [Actinomycetota bacterium]